MAPIVFSPLVVSFHPVPSHAQNAKIKLLVRVACGYPRHRNAFDQT
jgi:hypothetical protein